MSFTRSKKKERTMRLRLPLSCLLAAGALLVGCTAGDSDTASDDTTAAGGSTPPTFATGPAPGVTDDAIKVGVEFVDLEAIGDIASLDHGDYEAAYQALFDQINEDGGINGRMIEPTIVGVNPVGTDSAAAACTELTEDVQVFVIMGFFTGDAVLCPLETHQTAVFGGEMTPERLARAQAPWYTADVSTDLQTEAIRAMADAGELDGTLGVFGGATEQALIDDEVLPLLDELGIEVAETATTDNEANTDLTASNAQVAVIAERFDAAGIDQVLVVGPSGLAWANGVAATGYRPALRFTSPASVQAYANDESHDVSMLEGAVGGNGYGGNQNNWALPAMQECIQVVEDAGVPVPEPDSVPEDSGDVFLAGMEACNNVNLFRQLVEAAGEDLNYGSLAAAVDGLEVDIPGQPEPLTYGPPPAADGDMPAYLFDYDTDIRDFVLREP
jgi:hypothetical protein